MSTKKMIILVKILNIIKFNNLISDHGDQFPPIDSGDQWGE
jgi:hypothetical protein